MLVRDVKAAYVDVQAAEAGLELVGPVGAGDLQALAGDVLGGLHVDRPLADHLLLPLRDQVAVFGGCSVGGQETEGEQDASRM